MTLPVIRQIPAAMLHSSENRDLRIKVDFLLEFKPFRIRKIFGQNMIFCLVHKHFPDLFRNIDFPVNVNPVYRKLRGQFKAAAVKYEKVR